jgi:hypothetical protein
VAGRQAALDSPQRLPLPVGALARLAQDEEPGGAGGAARSGRGLVKEVEMTDEKPWRLADLIFEPMGDDRRETATIDGVVIVRQDGRYSITAPEQEWLNIDEDEVDTALNFLL